MLAAQTWKVTGSSSKVRSPSCSSSRCRSGSADHRWVPEATARRTVRSARSPYPASRALLIDCHSSVSRSTTARSG